MRLYSVYQNIITYYAQIRICALQMIETLDFPQYGSFSLFLAAGFFLTGTWGTYNAFSDWRDIIHFWRLHGATSGKQHEKEGYKLVLATFGGPLFLLLGLLLLITQPLGIYRFRSIQVNEIKTITVYRVADEYGPPSQEKREIGDDVIIQKGLALLQPCSSEVHQNHESFEDGFKLDLVSRSGSIAGSLLVFRRTNVNKNKAAVIPKLSPDAVRNAYSCPAFQAWVAENVERLFPAPR